MRTFAFGSASEPLGGRDDSFFVAGIRIHWLAGSLFDGQQRDAAEEKSGSAGIGAGKIWADSGECDRTHGRREGLPLAYNKDLQETQEPLFDSSDTLLQMLPLVTGWMRAVEFHQERMLQAAQSGFMNAWAAATYLVNRGVPSRHRRMRESAKRCSDALSADVSFRICRSKSCATISPAFDQDFYESLKLASLLVVHDVAGGTAPSRVRHAIHLTRKEDRKSVREEAHAHA